MLRKHDVGSAGQVADMQAVPEAKSVECAPQLDLGSGVLPADVLAGMPRVRSGLSRCTGGRRDTPVD